MNKGILSCLIFFCAISMFLFCNPQDNNENDCTPTEGKLVELTADVAGKTYSIGEKVTLTWKIDGNRITNGKVVIDVSPDDGISWSSIPDAGISVPAQYQCMTYEWTVGSEGEFADYKDGNNTCILRIHQYSDVSNGMVFSGTKFTVNK